MLGIKGNRGVLMPLAFLTNSMLMILCAPEDEDLAATDQLLLQIEALKLQRGCALHAAGRCGAAQLRVAKLTGVADQQQRASVRISELISLNSLVKGLGDVQLQLGGVELGGIGLTKGAGRERGEALRIGRSCEANRGVRQGHFRRHFPLSRAVPRLQ